MEWPWPIYSNVKFGNLVFFYRKKWLQCIFSEAIAASGPKIRRSRHLLKDMKICEYWSSSSFLDLVPRSCTYKNSNWIFSETTVPIWTKFCMNAFRYMEIKIWWHDAGHMTKMASTPIYGKNPSKIFFSGTRGPISTLLGHFFTIIFPGFVCFVLY